MLKKDLSYITNATSCFWVWIYLIFQQQSQTGCRLDMTDHEWLSWGLDRETVCGTFQPLLNHLKPPMQQNIQKLLHIEFCRLHIMADGKSWHSWVTHTLDTESKMESCHKLIGKLIKWTIRLCHLKSVLSCGNAVFITSIAYTLKCEMWSWGGQICRRWKLSLFISLLLISLNAAFHQSPDWQSHFVYTMEVLFNLVWLFVW